MGPVQSNGSKVRPTVGMNGRLSIWLFAESILSREAASKPWFCHVVSKVSIGALEVGGISGWRGGHLVIWSGWVLCQCHRKLLHRRGQLVKNLLCIFKCMSQCVRLGKCSWIMVLSKRPQLWVESNPFSPILGTPWLYIHCDCGVKSSKNSKVIAASPSVRQAIEYSTD